MGLHFVCISCPKVCSSEVCTTFCQKCLTVHKKKNLHATVSKQSRKVHNVHTVHTFVFSVYTCYEHTVHTVHTTSTQCTRHRLSMHWLTMFFLFQDPFGSKKAAATCGRLFFRLAPRARAAITRGPLSPCQWAADSDSDGDRWSATGCQPDTA